MREQPQTTRVDTALLTDGFDEPYEIRQLFTDAHRLKQTEECTTSLPVFSSQKGHRKQMFT